MRVRWNVAAAEDLQHIKNYLSEHHPRFAQSTVLELYETIRSLKTSPHRAGSAVKKALASLSLPAYRILPFTA